MTATDLKNLLFDLNSSLDEVFDLMRMLVLGDGSHAHQQVALHKIEEARTHLEGFREKLAHDAAHSQTTKTTNSTKRRSK